MNTFFPHFGKPFAIALVFLFPQLSFTANIELPNKSKVTDVNFERHIVGLFGKMGCNSGSCHGSFQGKGGFRLSLFGYDSDMDYQAVTRSGQGRRVNRVDPEQSLLLLKATGQMNHGGMRRFSKGSWQYQLLLEWIKSGMPRHEGEGDIINVTVNPPEITVNKVGEQQTLKVTAEFPGGATEDITPLCDFRVNDDAIAEVTSDGEVTTMQPGDTAVIVSYRGKVIPVRIMVPLTPKPGFKYPKLEAVNYLDQEVFAKLKRLNIVPSKRATDLEFLRRVTIDTIGRIPTEEEVRKFAKDKDPKKREKKIDELLKDPMHAALWATRFCDITSNKTDALENPRQMQPKLSQMWHDWFRERIFKNQPYDEIVRDVLCATSRDGKSPEAYAKDAKKIYEQAAKGWETSYPEKKTLDLFYRYRQRVPPEQLGEKVAVAFLGVRIECAQCHKHPFDRWTQEDYRGFANIFAPLTVGVSQESRKVFTKVNKELQKGKKRNQTPQLREVYYNTSGRGVRLLRHPTTNENLNPKALGGRELPLEKEKDVRVGLFEWMRDENNPFFARSFVNRLWGHYFGIGIVHPVDDFSLANPSSNDKLLDAMAKKFVESGYDIRKMEKEILMSRTYQTSSSVNETNKWDNRNYSHAYVRPMMAEVVLDVINTALGTKDNYGRDAPPNSRAIEVGGTTISSSTLREAFRVFGRTPRSVACDCERSTEPTVSYKLYLMADTTLQQKLDPRRNRLKDLIRDKNRTDESIIEELFLCTLSRFPTKDEMKLAKEHIASKGDRTKGLADTLWALINTNEFIFNH